MSPADPVPTGRSSVSVSPFFCPLCTSEPIANDCHHCGRTGLTDDVSGWDAREIVPVPRPPGVMTRPCADCAFRCGSPEQQADYDLHNLRDPNKPFYCHTGLPLIEGHYRSVAEYQPHPNGPVLPLGAMVCSGWWDWRTGGGLPLKPYRELHGDSTGESPASTAPHMQSGEHADG